MRLLESSKGIFFRPRQVIFEYVRLIIFYDED